MSSCGLTADLPVNITAANQTSANSVAATSPSFMNSTLSSEPTTDTDADSTGNIALMLREENAVIAFDTQFQLFYIVNDGDLYVSRFDIDPVKDTGGTLRITLNYRQYDHVSRDLLQHL